MDISLVVTVYNEQDNLPLLFEAIEKAMESLNRGNFRSFQDPWILHHAMMARN